MRRLVVRIFEAVVLAFALYAFVALPLGRRTGWGHVKAIFQTAPAKEAAREVPRALRKTLDQALGGGTVSSGRIATRAGSQATRTETDDGE